MPTRTAHLPNSFVPLRPCPFDILGERALQPPGIVVGFDAGAPGEMERVHDLAVNVELELVGCRVADSDGRGAFVAGQPVELELRQTTLSHDAVHDARLGRLTGDRAEQPLAPRA